MNTPDTGRIGILCQSVFFNSLTLTHPQDRALVSQEQHYYPFGGALSRVAVSTAAQPQVSQDEYKSAITNLYLPS